MSDKSAIEWTDATWNPTTGCTKVSPACANCYIERTTPFRMRSRKFIKGHIPLQFHEGRLEQPFHWTKPRRVFVNSLSDLFHDDVPDAFIDQVFGVMALTPQHTYQILTKRPERMLRYTTSIGRDDGEFEPDLDGEAFRDAMIEGQAQRLFVERGGCRDDADDLAVHQPLPNVWLGVSVENQHFADERIPLLLQTPAAVRFISAEPLLGPVDASLYLDPVCECETRETLHSGDGHDESCPAGGGKIDWVIAGGESGPRVRPSNPDWFRSLRDQCVAAGVPFLFKQWGGKTPKSGGRELDGRTWDEFPEVRS